MICDTFLRDSLTQLLHLHIKDISQPYFPIPFNYTSERVDQEFIPAGDILNSICHKGFAVYVRKYAISNVKSACSVSVMSISWSMRPRIDKSNNHIAIHNSSSNTSLTCLPFKCLILSLYCLAQ